jgi:hypothetical protein
LSNAPSAGRRKKEVYKLSIPVSKDTPGDLRGNRGWGYPDRTAPLKKRIIFKKGGSSNARKTCVLGKSDKTRYDKRRKSNTSQH